MLIALLLLYSLGASYLMIRKQKSQSGPSELDKIWQSVTSNSNPTVEDLKVIAELAKVRQGEIPWYERSLSTIGILAFFSMIIATSIQTISSARTGIESSNLRQEISQLESQRSSWKKLVKDLSEVITLKQASYGRLEKSEEEVLKQRISQLEETEKPSSEEEVEKLKIYLALKRYEHASALVDKSALLTSATPPESLLFLAEISFLDGARGRAKSLLEKFETQLSKQPVEWQLRYFFLTAALSVDPKVHAREVAALKQIPVNEAEQLLEIKVEQLKDQAKRRTISSEGSPTP